MATLATGLDRRSERIVAFAVRRDGVAVLMIDDPRAAANTITLAFEAELATAIRRIDEDPSIGAAVLVSGKPGGFVAGIDTGLLRSIKFAADAERLAGLLAGTLGRLERLRKPVVAAIHGPALGAGFELALACHAIVVSDDERTVVGLPQVRLGLIPAGNGALRIADRAGLRVAVDVTLGGESWGPARARLFGLIDTICPHAILVDAAAHHARTLLGRVPCRRDERGDVMTLALERNALGRRLLFRRVRERVRVETRGHDAASGLAVGVLERFATRGFAAAAELEARSFGELVVSETAHRLVEFALATASLARDSGVAEAVDARRVGQVVVIGGGALGTAIAHDTIDAGASVRLKEHDDVELADVDLVIDAVADDLSAKQRALLDVEALAPPQCIVASSSPSLPIARFAQHALHPQRLLGMHYLGWLPAGASGGAAPLLEVVRGERTSPWAVATAVALGKRQGKVVIVVNDGPGFYTTRVLVPYLNEAAQLAGDGVAIEAIDAAMVEWGFALGPLGQLDAIGLDVALQLAQSLHTSIGPRMTPPDALGVLVADGRRGHATERGFYRHPARTAHGPSAVDPAVYALLGHTTRTRLPLEELQMRCALALVNEAVRCLGEGILRDPRDGDVASVFGLGFPRFRGGPFRFVDALGAAGVLRRLQGYADRFGERWRPAPLLVQMAKKGARFFA